MSKTNVVSINQNNLIDPKSLIAGDDFQNHWCEGMTDEEYHADKSAVGSSQLRMILQSPKAFYHNFFLGSPKEETEALRFGKLAHHAILEGSRFLEKHVIEPEFIGLTKDGKPSKNSADAKAQREAWLANLPKDAIVCTPKDRDAIVGIIESISNHPQGLPSLSDGKAEVAGYFKDPVTGIKLKIKPDFLSFDCLRLVDLKTTADCSAVKFGQSAFNYRYDFQSLMYSVGIEEIAGMFPDVILNLCVEKTPPYECALYYWQSEDFFVAKEDYRKALDLLKYCIDNNSWPMRQKEIERIRVPNWFVNGNF